ncbi:MAG: HAMP domain-containing protein [Burkholderiales bacterium]|nr:HAMP domain-containing protein [Opitutaceae bacterium]
MKRWNFFSGLTIILMLLMTLGGYCIWITNTLTTDVSAIISTNFDALRAVRGLRDANTRLNAVYLAAETAESVRGEHNLHAVEAEMMRGQIATLRRLSFAGGAAEIEAVRRLDALVEDYLEGLQVLLKIPARKDEEFARQRQRLAVKSSEIASVGQDIVEVNERAILARRDVAMDRGNRSGYVAMGIVLMSLGIYIYTSMRLTQSVFQPLRELRDSILTFRDRRFAEFIPLKGEGELGKIAETFNEMASELRTYLAEQDDRVVSANRMCRAILEALPKPVYIVDDEQEVRMLNPRAERFSAALGVPGQLPSFVRHLIDEAAARDVDLVGDDLRRAIEVETGEYAPGVTKMSFLPQVFRMRGDTGASQGWAVLLVNVTNLRRLDEAKTKAISTLGHEVKTPVTGIRMTLHLLLEESLGALTPDQRELIESGRDDCERLLAVLQALLELARLESGRGGLKPEPVTAEVLLSQVDAMHGSVVRQLGRQLRVEPVAPGLSSVAADTLHAGRVLGNFLSNAVKYGMADRPVVLRAQARADGYVRFSVVNTGTRPMSEAEQARIFEPFYRRSGEKAEGSGLGLTIAKEIAMLHGGRVGVWCEGDQVEFYLDLRGV